VVRTNSGKTTLISVVSFLVPRGLLTTGISEAALFRSIEKWLPTVIADEADVLLVDNDPLRAVINSGWTRGAGVLRYIGDDSTPHSFPTFCPKIVGMKGRKLPDTTLSRSIIVEMRRKRPGDKAEHFRSIDDVGLAELRQRALRWANDNGEKLDVAEPDMPPGFDCRLGDNWSLLLAIADHAGGDWRDRARKAAVRLAKVADATSIGVQLLTDIKGVFDGLPGADGDREPLERISSADLAAALGADMASPWAEWRGGKPITQAQLARALKPFGLAPAKIRLSSGGTLQGYVRSQFADAWDRYL
jgi:putative DNA primase/helicase